MLADQQLRRHQARLLRQAHREDALAAAALCTELADVRALAVAVLRDGKHLLALLHLGDVDDLVALGQVDGAHAHGVAAHRAHVALAEADRLTHAGRQHQLAVSLGQLHADELVVLAQRDSDQAHLAQVGKLVAAGLLDQAVAGRHDQIALLALLGQRNHRRHLFAAVQLQQVHDRGAARGASGLRDLVALEAVHASLVGEEHDLRVRGGDQQPLRVVLLARRHAHHALAAAVLAAVGRARDALDIAKVRQRHHDAVLLNEVLRIDLAVHGGDLRAALIGVLLLDGQDLFPDDAQHQLFVRQHGAQVRDGLLQLRVFLLQALAFQAGQAGQTHVQNRLRLLVGQRKALHELNLRLARVRASADDAHDLVDVVQRDEQALQDVGAGLGLVQVVARPAGDDVLLMLQVVIEHLSEREHLRLAVHQRQHDRAEDVLHLRMLVEVIEHHSGVHVALELDDDAHALAVALVADVADAVQTLVVHQLRDLGNQRSLVDHVRDLGDDDALTVVRHRLDIRLRAHNDASAAGGVGVVDAPAPQDQTTGREVRTLDTLHQLLAGGVGLVNQLHHAVDHLAEVVRRDVRRHADGDAGGAVDQQVRETAGQHARLHERLVEVRGKVNRFLVDVREHLHVHFAHAGFGVSHGRRAVTVDGAEVALALDQRIAGGKVLRQAHQRAVDGGIAVRVIFTQNVADNARALAERLVGGDAQLMHGVENAAVHRLEAVAHVRQGARDDDRHRVGDEGLLHLLFQVNRANALQIGRIARQIVLEIQQSFLPS